MKIAILQLYSMYGKHPVSNTMIKLLPVSFTIILVDYFRTMNILDHYLNYLNFIHYALHAGKKH